MSVWSVFFGWPTGGVWSNLVAAGLWALPGFGAHHVLMRRHTTREIERVAAEQTAELKAHIDQGGTR